MRMLNPFKKYKLPKTTITKTTVFLSGCLIVLLFCVNQGLAAGPWTITGTAGFGGSVSPTSTTVNDGGQAFFSIMPDTRSGYEVRDVRIDGVSKGPIESYYFQNVHSNHNLYANFNQSNWQHTIFATADAVII